MHWLTLPEPRKNIALAFHDPASAKAWLASQPQAQPMHMLAAISLQIEGIEASSLPPPVAIELLDLMRTAAVPGQEIIEPQYTRKALPMLDDDQRAFEVAQRLWLRLGTAYLRLAPHFSPADKTKPLHRAACAFRMAQYCHFLAARECPNQLDQLLIAILDQAERDGLLRQALPDPDFRHLVDTSIAGHLAWAFMLRLIDPYRLSAAQLTVANRALSRWRELAGFQSMPDDDPRGHSVDLGPLFGGPLPEGIPRWLEVPRVTRKIAQRIAALKAGESPESLKLGRELSPAACIRLLRDIEASLESHSRQPSTEIGEIELAFGAEFAYAAFTGEMLVQSGSLEASSASLAHQRTAMFGFDRVSTMPTAVKKLNVPSENWLLVDGKAIRPADRKGARRQSPCLIASSSLGVPRLGVMIGLQSIPGGALAADLRWYEERVEAGRLNRPAAPGQTAPVVPVFLLRDGDLCSLIVPSVAGIRLHNGVTLEGTSLSHLMPTEVLERGVDFVRYAVMKQ
ncbi:MAG: hypothetical protein KKE51_01940 [Gammaproteobacteria bacterium]|nr:hypothetical protein [Gammaproteobacteria bacterium]MBU1600753.1 hypothetical protein [Gammaproteobacteria bacterium]MBU2435209.1 hypothetical protein [Gammaproteobacteria bacterium]MBU2448623.1 hypothetical protein [Gammaproteobacteria bacterium]